MPEGARIEVADVGALPANLAVTAVRPLGDRVVATIRNVGPAREAHARLAVEGRAPVDQKLAVGANQSADVVFGGPPHVLGKQCLRIPDCPDVSPCSGP